jgi:hypothetical protein
MVKVASHRRTVTEGITGRRRHPGTFGEPFQINAVVGLAISSNVAANDMFWGRRFQ